MKKMIVIMLTMVLAMVVSACSNDKSPTTEENATTTEENATTTEENATTTEENTTTTEASKSAKEMVDQMLTEVEQPSLMELTEEEMQNLYNIDLAKLEDYSVRIPMMNVKANEIAVFKVIDEADVADVEAAVKTRAENVMKTFEQYLPDQYENAKNYKIVVKGNYVLFVISDSADDLIKVYDSFFEKK